MTLQEFFRGRAIWFLVLLALALGVLGYKTYLSPTNKETTNIPPLTENIEKGASQSFEWKFQQSKTNNPDGNPATDVYLTITYANAVVEDKFIQTSDGGCNELPDTEKDSAPNTTNIQCYYAGLGYKFKITKGEASYLVLRKEFEEGSPDYNPPEQEYQKVAEFPL